MPGKIKTCCYLIRKQPYSETSVLMQVFSDELGMTSVLAKGLHAKGKQKTHELNVLNEYEFVIGAASPSGIHTLHEMTLINEYPADLPLENWFAAQAGVEILTKLMFPDDEVLPVYQALRQYLTYIKGVAANPLAIFWRFLLHLTKLLGVPVNQTTCPNCGKAMQNPGGYLPDSGQLICANCIPLLPVTYNLSPEAAYIIGLLPSIGNHLNDLTLTPEISLEIDRYFLHYLSVHFHKGIRLKSLQFFEPK
jgi:DNA repair protein RecO